MTDFLGVIDRGVGGLGFYQKLRQVSSRPVLYFADSGYMPYGKADKKILKKRLDKIIALLKSKGAKKIVIACNSASVAYPENEDVKGIISFGVSSVLKELKHSPELKKLALIAGKSTVKSGFYRKLFRQHNIEMRQRIAQPLSINIENGEVSGEQFDQDLMQILNPIKNYDLLLHACTHYPAANPDIKKIMQSNCKIIDPVDDLVSWVESHWSYQSSADQNVESHFFCSGELKRFVNSAKLSFQVTPENLNLVKII